MDFQTTNPGKSEYTDVEHLEPGTLFITEKGKHGIRLYSSVVLLTGPYPKAWSRSGGEGTSLRLPGGEKVKALPKGETFTITQK